VPHNLLLTGPPGIGKTTVIGRALAQLPPLPRSGFTTAEIRGARGRLGFLATTLDGREIVLAHVDTPGRPRVARYGVDVDAFEREIVPALDPRLQVDLFIVDEIGKMECFSGAFCATIERLLQDPRPLLGTIALRGPAFIQRIHRRDDVQIVQVTRANRETLPKAIGATVESWLSLNTAR
jgi:nucleoside-triphosphatase